jgi:hypothetical protein
MTFGQCSLASPQTGPRRGVCEIIGKNALWLHAFSMPYGRRRTRAVEGRVNFERQIELARYGHNLEIDYVGRWATAHSESVLPKAERLTEIRSCDGLFSTAWSCRVGAGPINRAPTPFGIARDSLKIRHSAPYSATWHDQLSAVKP